MFEGTQELFHLLFPDNIHLPIANSIPEHDDVRRHHEKRIEEGLNDSVKSLTRTETRECRKFWRDAKRRQTEKMSDEKKQMLLAKRRERYLEKKV